MTADQEWRGDSRLAEQLPRATGCEPQAQRAPVSLESTLDSLHNIQKHHAMKLIPINARIARQNRA
jgi:hypothetical protein